MEPLVSRVYRPDPGKCCETCAFGRGKHAHWCPEGRGEECEADGRKAPACMACALGRSDHAEWCGAEKAA